MSDFLPKLNPFSKTSERGTIIPPVNSAEKTNDYTFVEANISTDELMMTLPEITSDTLILRRSGQEFVTVSLVSDTLSGLQNINISSSVLESEGITPHTPPIRRYAKLEYGAEKDLICKQPVLAKSALTGRPNLQIMWENYLYDRPEGIWGEIGGLVEVNGNLPFDQGRWTNACAVRLSHMLLKAGVKIPKRAGKTVSGGNGGQYFFRLADAETFLHESFGDPDKTILDGTANWLDLPSKPGIVLMDFPDRSFTGHVTIWNGAGTVDGSEIGGYRVLFWKLPCFIPEGREILLTQASEIVTAKLP